MSDIAIRVQNLSKQYRIGAKEAGYRTIRESIPDGIRAPFKNIRALRKLTKFDNSSNNNGNDVIWALKDVSFEVKEGKGCRSK